jgi:hypothetical protein
LLTAGVLTLWIIVLHVVRLFHAGPLWRDEADMASYASMRTFGEMWQNLSSDHFPILFHAVARVWTQAGLGSDFGYRLLGLLIGMGTLAALWWCGLKLGGKAPLLVLALYAAHPLAVSVGDSLRPYGLGVALAFLTSAFMWSLVKTPGTATFLRTLLVAILSVQCLYRNAFFLIAFCCGAWVVTLARGDWKTTVQIGVIGLVAALSLAPYWSLVIQGRESADILAVQMPLAAIWRSLNEALRGAGQWTTFVWVALFIASLGLSVLYGGRRGRWDMAYCGMVLVISAPLYFLFLRALHQTIFPWYFLSLMAMTALMLDAILGAADTWRPPVGRVMADCASLLVTIPTGPRWAWLRQWRPLTGRAVLGLLLVAAGVSAGYSGACLRQSNIDLVAARLQEASRPGDMILVFPSAYGISLGRYLDAGRWTTVEPTDELRIHRTDLIKKAMMREDPIRPLREKVRVALRSGRKVWLVGDFGLPADAGHPPPILPPYTGKMERAAVKYILNWMTQVAYLVKQHAAAGSRVEIPVPGGQAVNPRENVVVQVASGWRD